MTFLVENGWSICSHLWAPQYGGLISSDGLISRGDDYIGVAASSFSKCLEGRVKHDQSRLAGKGDLTLHVSYVSMRIDGEVTPGLYSYIHDIGGTFRDVVWESIYEKNLLDLRASIEKAVIESI